MPVNWLDKLTALSTINKPLTYSTFNPYFSISAKSWVRGGIGKLLRLVNYTAAAAPNLVPRVLSYLYAGRRRGHSGNEVAAMCSSPGDTPTSVNTCRTLLDIT